MPGPVETPAWQALQKHHQSMSTVHMRDLFARDARRFEKFSLRLGDILFDYSKNRITGETMSLLFDLARQANLAGRIESMFSGEKINTTENRAVLHVALRNRSNRPIIVDGADVMPEVNRVLAQMRTLQRGGPLGRVEGLHRQADHRYRQYRHRRLGPRAQDGGGGAQALRQSRDSGLTSSPTSTAPTSPRR